MMLSLLSFIALAFAVPPAILFFRNLCVFRPARARVIASPRPAISILIPARDEELSIRASVESVLASRDVDLEVIVMDDHSRDATASIVRAIAARDARARLVEAPDLPPGWCGKTHACALLSELASKPTLVFIDSDVRLTPSGLARMAARLDESGADILSGFPRQETAGLVEKMVIPLMHFILLGFLPIQRMRSCPMPGLAVGCGQLFITRKSAYEQAGGHAAIRSTLHDGLKLPRAFRAAGLRSDVFDASDMAVCRMYRSAGELWRGLARNATEGLAAPAMIVPTTLVFFGGQVLPLLLLVSARYLSTAGFVMAASASIAAYVPRLLMVWRFQQPLAGAILHPVGVAILLAIQWHALVRDLLGYPATWKGRVYRPIT
jgi:Glycosyl transferase family 2